jgi:hypothetical protein
MDTGLVVFGTSTDIAVGSGDRLNTDVLVCRGDCVRGTREFIPRTMKTFDQRG